MTTRENENYNCSWFFGPAYYFILKFALGAVCKLSKSLKSRFSLQKIMLDKHTKCPNL